MTVFRVHLADGDRRLKADLKAHDEQSVRANIEQWFDRDRWRILQIKPLQ
jgi:hypothetical protein